MSGEIKIEKVIIHGIAEWVGELGVDIADCVNYFKDKYQGSGIHINACPELEFSVRQALEGKFTGVLVNSSDNLPYGIFYISNGIEMLLITQGSIEVCPVK